jgi:hypothetical protein
METVLPVRAAAMLFLVPAVGFLVANVLIARHLLEHRELPMSPFGWRYMAGPFEAFGVETFVILLAAFQVVCALEAIAGWLLWNDQRGGGVLGLALLPVAAIFWYGFELPLPPLWSIARAAVVIANWSALK